MVPPLSGAWGPEGGIGHDAGTWVFPANGWAPMEKVTPQEEEHIPRFAGENHALAINCQVGRQEVFIHMVMSFFARDFLDFQHVALWPNVEGSMGQCDDALQAPKILLISVGRGLQAASALARNSIWGEGGSLRGPSTHWLGL